MFSSISKCCIFQICLSLVRLLHYLAHSPLGSITLLDFRPRQFVIVDGELKVTDLDDASMEETPCTSNEDCFMEFPARNFTLQCSVEGKCQNMNEKRNLYNAYRYVYAQYKLTSLGDWLAPRRIGKPFGKCSVCHDPCNYGNNFPVATIH